MSRLFVWEKGSEPFVGIDLQPTASASHHRFVQGNKTVGHAWIDAPAGAAYGSTTTGPSALVPNPVTSVPTGGLDTRFVPDSGVSGDYEITCRLNNGNAEHQYIRVH